MPGGKGFVDSPTWFEDKFGFKEASFAETKSKFDFADGVLLCKHNGAKFRVGSFETPSLAELNAKIETSQLQDRISFENVTGSAKTMILDKRNEGAVFQVASQFNCLEMNEPGARPENGVTRYYCDATQGPACALACPAATVYRNYFAPVGSGQAGKGNQIDCLADVGALLNNDKDKHWKMQNGYCLPVTPDGQGIAAASQKVSKNEDLAQKVREALRIGVHWDTEVKTGSHGVCQVFSSAVPVAYAKQVKSKDWEPLARCILEGSYEATLAAATILALERQARVTVFLTAVGGGAFGNRSNWIHDAMERALKAFALAPLDVKLVHFGTVPRSTYTDLEKGRKPRKTPAGQPPSVEGAPAATATAGAAAEGDPEHQEGENEVVLEDEASASSAQEADEPAAEAAA